MDAERWRFLKAILEDALNLEPAERSAFLDARCGDDVALRSEVETLLAAEDEVGTFIEAPAFALFGTDLEEPELPYEQVGAYHLSKLLARGGMGAVYLGLRADEEFEQRVAIKIVKRGMDTAEIVHRFRYERQILADLHHPNIARLFDGGTTEDGVPYFVMEYVEGRPIDRYCDEKRLPTTERLQLFRTICSAVHFAHQNMVVHRDLKPANILVTTEGAPKLLDFGIAKLLGPEAGLTRAMTEMRLMTPEYASPEQLRGEAVNTISDVYSLGVLLYQLLTGHRPYYPGAPWPDAFLEAIATHPPARPSTVVVRSREIKLPNGATRQLDPNTLSALRDGDPKRLQRRLAGDLDRIVLKAIHPQPAARYASAEQLAEDIQRHLTGLPVRARPATVGYRLGKFARRNRLLLTGLTVLIVLGLGLVSSVVRSQQLERASIERTEELINTLFELLDGADPESGALSGDELKDQIVERIVDADEIINAQVRSPVARATLLGKLGGVYRRLGRYEEAEGVLKTNRDLRRQHLGEGHPDLAVSLINLAALYVDRDRCEEAEPRLDEAFDILRNQSTAPTELLLAKGMHNLALCAKKQGNYKKAVDNYRRSLTIKERLDPDGRSIERTRNNLSTALRLTCGFDEAETLLRKVLEDRRRTDPRSHDVSVTLNNLAFQLRDRRRFGEADRLFTESLTIRREVHGIAHPRTAKVMKNLGRSLALQGELERAGEMLREALEILEVADGKRHDDVADVRRYRADLLLAEGDAEACEASARAALEIRREIHPAGHWEIADAESTLGGCLVGLGRYEEAAEFLVSSVPVLEGKLCPDAPELAEARDRLTALITAQGKPLG